MPGKPINQDADRWSHRFIQQWAEGQYSVMDDVIDQWQELEECVNIITFNSSSMSYCDAVCLKCKLLSNRTTGCFRNHPSVVGKQYACIFDQMNEF